MERFKRIKDYWQAVIADFSAIKLGDIVSVGVKAKRITTTTKTITKVTLPRSRQPTATCQTGRDTGCC